MSYILSYPFLQLGKSGPGQKDCLAEITQLGRARARSYAQVTLPPVPRFKQQATVPWFRTELGL